MFTPATKSQARLRLALIGPAGSGKTYSALVIAKALAGPSGRVACIDTEHGSASKYADLGFDTVSLSEPYTPAAYIAAIRAAETLCYSVLVIDSLSHAWAGPGGALQMVEDAAARSQGNKFAGWRTVTPQCNALTEAIIACKCHIIATMRSRTEWAIEENERGKKVPRKIGTAPIQRDGMDYEFDVVGDLDQDHTLVISKTRCPALDSAVIKKPGADLAKILLGWLSEGQPIPSPRATPTAGRTATDADAWSAALAAQQGVAHSPPVQHSPKSGMGLAVAQGDGPGAAELDSLVDAINAAETPAQLGALRPRILAFQSGTEPRKVLSDLFNARQGQLRK